MRKLFLTAVLAVFTLSITSCEPETEKDQLANEFAIDQNESTNSSGGENSDPDNGED